MNNTKYNITFSRDEVEKRQGHKGCVLWMTGLSGSGKSTLANKIQQELFKQGVIVKILDADSVRQGVCTGLGFPVEDRAENLRRVAFLAKLFAEHGVITICSFISPLEKNRKKASEILGDDYHMVFVDTPLSVCENRDPKGLYKKAREGEISEFTGISSPFEPPKDPNIHLKGDLEMMGNTLLSYLVNNKLIKSFR